MAIDGPFIAVFGSSIPSSPKKEKKEKKNFITFGPPFTKLSGSAHEMYNYFEEQDTLSLA